MTLLTILIFYQLPRCCPRYLQWYNMSTRGYIPLWTLSHVPFGHVLMLRLIESAAILYRDREIAVKTPYFTWEITTERRVIVKVMTSLYDHHFRFVHNAPVGDSPSETSFWILIKHMDIRVCGRRIMSPNFKSCSRTLNFEQLWVLLVFLLHLLVSIGWYIGFATDKSTWRQTKIRFHINA